MTEEEQLYKNIGSAIGDAEASMMFGKPCYKINGKAFVAFYNQCMVFKLSGVQHTTAINLEGAQLFDPSGKNRPMKEWVQLPFSQSEHWPGFTKVAYDTVKFTTKRMQ